MSGTAQGRIEGLVTWRALLMLAGLVLHATNGREDYEPFAIINIVSGSFRMGTFFMISGLLTGLALNRHADGLRWLERRMLQLAFPTIFGIVVLCPAIHALLILTGAHNPGLSIYHLWFMVALMDYTVVAWLVHRADLAWPIFQRVERAAWLGRLRQSILLVGTGTLSFVLMVQIAAMSGRWSGDQASLLRQLPLVAGYAPVFLIGLACGRVPTLRRILIGGIRVPALILALIAAAHVALRSPLAASLDPSGHAALEQALLFAGAAWCPPAAAALILRSAIAIRRVPPILRRLSAASLTMYLAHYPLMVIVAAAIRPLAVSPWWSFVSALIVGGGGSYLIHTELVERSRWLILIVNGRWSRRTITARAEPPFAPAWDCKRESGELLLPGAPRTAGIPFCCPVGSDRAILE